MTNEQRATEPGADAAWPERVVRWFDRHQVERPWLAFPIGVVRKYADDRASAFSALLTHYGFLAMFPLFVLLLTLLDRLAITRPALQDRIVESVVVQLPVVGERLREAASALEVRGLVIVLSVASLFWGATGLYNSAQLVMSQVWNVEGVDRPGFFGRLARAALLFTTLAVGVAVTAVAWWFDLFRPSPAAVQASSVVLAALLGTATLLAALRIVTPPVVPWRRLVAPAAMTAVAFESLQFVAQWLVSRRLDRLDDLYGVFAVVLVTIAWLNLVTRVCVFSVEASVVWHEGLWPRRLAQPPLTAADREALDRIVRNEHRRPEQRIEIEWDDDASVRADR